MPESTAPIVSPVSSRPGPSWGGCGRGGRRSPVRALAALGLLLAVSCGVEPPPVAQPHTRVLVVGLDGLEWSVLGPLLKQGKCPNLAALMQRGLFGRLATFRPTWSPVVWTSVATGRRMEDHGIRGFTDPQGRVYTSARRNGRALWDIADRYGLRSGVVGWFTTWPVVEIDGVMVSGTNAAAQLEQNWKPALMPGIEGQVHPAALEARVFELAEAAGAEDQVAALAERVFGPGVVGSLPSRETKLVNESLWSIQSDATYMALAEEVFADPELDLMLTYFGGTDVLGHRFWRQLHPEQFAWSGSRPSIDNALACTIPRYYEIADEWLGRLLAVVGEDVTVIVLSDHGMHEEPTSIEKEPSHGSTGNHQDGAPGVLIAAGPGIRQNDGEYQRYLDSAALSTKGSVLDIAPTVLGLLGIPGSKEFYGRLRRGWLVEELREPVTALGLVETHDAGFREPSMLVPPEEANAAFDDRMTALGYVGGDAEEATQLANPEEFDVTVGPSACR